MRRRQSPPLHDLDGRVLVATWQPCQLARRPRRKQSQAHLRLQPIAQPLDEQQAAFDEATDRGSQGYGSFLAGAQIRAGAFVIFGQYQVTTGRTGALLTGATHNITGGARVSLGSAREGYDIR